MARTSNLYNVKDTKTNSYILQEGEITDVANMIGIKKEKVSLYAWSGSLFKDRFEIEKAEEVTQEWIVEWNKIRTAAKLLKTKHGRIVETVVNGIVKKYVEVV